jgi:hypothetical protein
MTVDNVQSQPFQTAVEKPPITVQNEIQKEVLKDTLGSDAGSTQKQLLAMLANTQPQDSIQKTAQNQIKKGYLDIRV